jgi:hypothetical protein
MPQVSCLLNRISRRCPVGAAFAFAFAAAAAFAMPVPVTIEQLARDADLVVVGNVAAVSAERRGELIYSLARIKVEQVVKGQPSTEITVESLGGRVGDQVLAVSGGVAYAAGERVVVFLKKAEKSGTYQTAGLRQGKLLVQGDMVLGYNQSLEVFLRRVRAVLGETAK